MNNVIRLLYIQFRINIANSFHENPLASQNPTFYSIKEYV